MKLFKSLFDSLQFNKLVLSNNLKRFVATNGNLLQNTSIMVEGETATRVNTGTLAKKGLGKLILLNEYLMIVLIVKY